MTAQWTRRAQHLEEEEGPWAAAEGTHINCGTRHAIGEPVRAGWLAGWSAHLGPVSIAARKGKLERGDGGDGFRVWSGLSAG